MGGEEQHCAAATSSQRTWKYNKGRLPDDFDWRAFGLAERLKSQGGCGCCWAMSADGATIEPARTAALRAASAAAPPAARRTDVGAAARATIGQRVPVRSRPSAPRDASATRARRSPRRRWPVGHPRRLPDAPPPIEPSDVDDEDAAPTCARPPLTRASRRTPRGRSHHGLPARRDGATASRRAAEARQRARLNSHARAEHYAERACRPPLLGRAALPARRRPPTTATAVPARAAPCCSSSTGSTGASAWRRCTRTAGTRRGARMPATARARRSTQPAPPTPAVVASSATRAPVVSESAARP